MDSSRGSPVRITLLVLCLLAIPFAALQPSLAPVHMASAVASWDELAATPVGTPMPIWGERGEPAQPPGAFDVPAFMEQRMRHQALMNVLLDFDADAYYSGLSSSLQLPRTASVAGRQQYTLPLRL